MAHTDHGGALSSTETWSAGIHHITSQVTFGIYNLVLDASAGDVWVAVKSGVNALLLQNSGSISTTGTGIYKVYITSENDPAVSAEVGGTGTPALGDYGYIWDVTGDTATVNVSRLVCRYSSGTKGVLAWESTTDKPSKHVTLSRVTMRYCGVLSGRSAFCTLVGMASDAYGVGNVSIDHLDIDSTCTSEDSTWGNCICLFTSAGTFSMTDCRVTPGGTVGWSYLAYVGQHQDPATVTITNGLFEAKCKNWIVLTQAYDPDNTGHIVTCTLRSLILKSLGGLVSSGGLVGYSDNHSTNNMTVYDTIVTGCNGSGQYAYKRLDGGGGSAINYTLNNCVSWDNTNRVGASITDNNPINTNPQLQNLPTGCLIDTENCVFSDGYAIGNLGQEFQGSDTYNNIGIPVAICTQTGWKYSGTKVSMPGIYYSLLRFPEAFGTVHPKPRQRVPTFVTVMEGRGWGASQDTGYVEVGGAGVTESGWSDAGSSFTVPVMGNSPWVTASVTNYRGASFGETIEYLSISAPRSMNLATGGYDHRYSRPVSMLIATGGFNGVPGTTTIGSST